VRADAGADRAPRRKFEPCGGAVPSADGTNVIINLAGLDRVRDVDEGGWSITAEAGVKLSALQELAISHQRHFGVDLGARDTAMLGGLIASNAGGMSVLRYGTMRDQVLGLEAVMPDGSLWQGLRALRKDNSGPDVKQMLVGSEGTLGIVTAATLRLHPPEHHSTTILLALADADAINPVADAILETGLASAIELMPRWATELACRDVVRCGVPLATDRAWLIQARLAGRQPVTEIAEETAALLFERGIVTDAILADSKAREDHLWAIRDAFSPLHNSLGETVRFDLSVPLGAVPQLLHKLEMLQQQCETPLRLLGFGHLGDGNLHLAVCEHPDGSRAAFCDRRHEMVEAVHAIVWGMGGSISAEHGIGQLHLAELEQQKPAEELALQRAIKSAIDPLGLFNPGKLFAPERSDVSWQ